jgi:3-dehydroquinate dehydratase
MIKDVGGATVVAPMIKDYLDVGIKNDDQLVKLSAVLQRVISGGKSPDDGGDYTLSDEEKEQLLKSVQGELKDIKHVDEELNTQLDEITEPLTQDGA